MNAGSHSERESEGSLDITHPTNFVRGATLFSMDNWEKFQELMEEDKLREITLDYWCEYKGGVFPLVVPTVTLTNLVIAVSSSDQDPNGLKTFWTI